MHWRGLCSGAAARYAALMGEIRVQVKLSNLTDPARRATAEMLVDTGASRVYLPSGLVRRLGLRKVAQARVRYADGRTAWRPVVAPLKITIDGRVAVLDAVSGPAGTEPLLGLLALEALDLVPDPTTRRLEPKHPGKGPLMRA
ncbi:MAG TPA: retroviral-like aspartic protease family protein [bacterium]|nr:retroviral-like aspartic protease family protein [bacterium]